MAATCNLPKDQMGEPQLSEQKLVHLNEDIQGAVQMRVFLLFPIHNHAVQLARSKLLHYQNNRHSDIHRDWNSKLHRPMPSYFKWVRARCGLRRVSDLERAILLIDR